jgi:hypothetical protein
MGQLSSFLRLGPTAQGEVRSPEQSASIPFYSSFVQTTKRRVVKWEECGWKISWPIYFCSLISLHPSEVDYLVSKQFSFYGVRLLAWRTRVSLFVWLLPHDLSGMCAPTSSYATAGIALKVARALKPNHHDKVETPLVGPTFYPGQNSQTRCLKKIHTFKIM